jgi:hypothetical protein
VDDAFRYALACHCSRCRRATGSAFKPFGGIERDRLALTAGADRLLTLGDPASAHDVRCGACGSLLFSVVRENAWVHVTYGTLHDAPSLGVQGHIMVGSKAPWHVIADGLPQSEEF